MFKKLMMGAFAAAAAMFVAGCASVQTGTDFNGQKISTTAAKDVSHINGQNWGIYCLWIPVVSGSTDQPGSTVWFKDTVNVGSVVKMVTAKSKELGGTSTLDITSHSGSTWIMPALVLFYKEVEVSGNSVAAPAAK